MKIKMNFKKILDYLKHNYCVILLIVMFFVGIISGSFLFNNALNNSNDIVNQFAGSLLEEQSRTHAFINCTTIYSLYYLTIIFSGFSLAGQYILYIIPFIKGMTYGYTSSFICSIFGVNGLLINIIGILPQTVSAGFLLVFVCKTAIGFSKRILKEKKGIKIRQFVLLQVILFSITILFSLADVFITNAVIMPFV